MKQLQDGTSVLIIDSRTEGLKLAFISICGNSVIFSEGYFSSLFCKWDWNKGYSVREAREAAADAARRNKLPKVAELIIGNYIAYMYRSGEISREGYAKWGTRTPDQITEIEKAIL